MNERKIFKQLWYDGDTMLELNSYIDYISEANIRLVGCNWIEEMREQNNSYYFVISEGNCPDILPIDTSEYPYGIISALISGRYDRERDSNFKMDFTALHKYPKPKKCSDYSLPKSFDYKTVWNNVMNAKYYKSDIRQIDFIGYQGYAKGLVIGYFNEELLSVIINSDYSDIMFVRIL